MFKFLVFYFLTFINFHIFSMEKYGKKKEKVNNFFDPDYVRKYANGNKLFLIANSKKEAFDFIQNLKSTESNKKSIFNVSDLLQIQKGSDLHSQLLETDERHVFLAKFVKGKEPLPKNYKVFGFWLGTLDEIKL